MTFLAGIWFSTYTRLNKVRSTMPNLDCNIFLSDGWYQIKAKLDQPLKEFVKLKRIFLGQKLHICGASVRSYEQNNYQIVGQLEACAPLEASDKIQLSICCNGTRRARWDSRLGKSFLINSRIPVITIFYYWNFKDCQ
jgi:breast cancer 2 susceptibility protein